ncbi:MAG: cupin domain-containing protein, partial [Devosia sp.]
MSKPIVNLADLELRDTSKGSRYAARAGRIGGVIGMQQLGAQYIVVPAGKAAYPLHSHRNNEEIFV